MQAGTITHHDFISIFVVERPTKAIPARGAPRSKDPLFTMSRHNHRIYLTGFMGCGKSTVGALLAERMGLDFVDLDETIAEGAGRSIEQIFADDGEDRFRSLEAEVLRRALRPAVYATGGGALAIEANLRWALDHGTVIYLTADPEILAQRLLTAETQRPLLLDASGKLLSPTDLQRRIEQMLIRRTPFYERAHITVAADSLPADQTATVIARALQQRHGNRTINDA